MANFFSSYEKAIEEKPTNKQAALSSIETKYTDSFTGKTNYIDLNGLFSRMVDKKELNERYRLNNGYLTNSLVSYSAMTSNINNLTNLKEYLDLYDIPFAYVQTPHVIPTDDDPMIPFGYETHVNGNSDRLLEGLEKNGVNYLDLRENFKADDISHYDIYPKTDHHWTPEGAFVAHSYLTEYLNSLLSEHLLNSSLFDISSYNIDIFENFQLGSHGTRTGSFFAGVDSISIIYPKFNTNYSCEVPSKDIKKTGSFEICIFDLSKMKIFNSAYGAYLGGNVDYRKITNFEVNNNYKILIISDSFSRTLAPFLSLHFNEVHMYDVRSEYGGTAEGFIQKLHEIQPDFVIQVRTTSNALSNTALTELNTIRNTN